MRKNERFRMAMERSQLAPAIEADFKGWGAFHIDNADSCLLIATSEGINPVLLAVTWLNETTFRYYSEPNTNSSDDPYFWDCGPMQTNRGVIQSNLANKFISGKGIDIQRALASTAAMFTGDPMENLRLGARLLARIGRGTITGPQETVLYPSAVDTWATMDDSMRNERRCVAYTGPEARPARYRSWVKYAPMFETFFTNYNV